MGYGALDSLASNGIIDFDANAYVNGTPPRYIGAPSDGISLPGELPAYATKAQGNLKGEPEVDAFISNSEKKTNNMPLSTILTGGAVAAIIVGLGIKAKSLFKGPNQNAKGFIGSIKDKVTTLFTKKEEVKSEEKLNTGKEATKETSKTKEAIKKAVKEGEGFFKKHPKLKTGGLVAAGVLGLYGIYKILTGHKIEPQQQEA